MTAMLLTAYVQGVFAADRNRRIAKSAKATLDIGYWPVGEIN